VQPFTDQRLLLGEIKNHAEFKVKLTRLKLTTDLPVLESSVVEVVKSWFGLAREHANELAGANPLNAPRTAYSRAYYAAYNASKAVRYLSQGSVSLRGDDHRKVSDLPDSFPDVEAWGRDLQVMYEHRLRADYDNWTETPNEHTLQPQDCAALAHKFLAVCAKYLNDVYGVTV